MKKIICTVTTCLMAVSLIACRASSNADNLPEAAVKSVPQTQIAATVEKPSEPAATIEESAEPEEIDCVAQAQGYKLEVLSVEKGKDAQGSDALVVSYRFTNFNSTQAAFWEVADYKLSQNGTNLSVEGMAINAGGAYTQPISNGQSVVVSVPYPYISESDPVDITIYVCDYNYNKIANASCSVYMS